MNADATHADKAQSLADYARGRLDAVTRAEVAAHLGTCEECCGMLEAYSLLATASRGDAMGPHMTSAAIAALAVVDPGTEPAPAEKRHLDTCQDCSEDLRLARAANDDAAASAPAVAAGSASRTRWILPLAAGFAVALLGLATVATLRHSGALSGRVAALENDNATLRSQVADLSRLVAENRAAGEQRAATGTRAGEEAAPVDEGAIPYVLLHATVRGAGGVQSLSVRPGHSSIYLALAIEVPATARHPGEGGRALLSDASGREVWTADLDGAGIDSLVASGDALLLRIPAAVLSAGRMEVRVTPATPAGGKRIWFRSEFEVSVPDRLNAPDRSR